MARKKSDETERISVLEAQVKNRDEALQIARSGLFRIANLSPVSFPGGPNNKNLKIVKAFNAAQGAAEKTLIQMSDKEEVDV